MESVKVIKLITIFFLVMFMITISWIFFRNQPQKSPSSDCITILENKNSINIIFLSYKYNSQDTFLKDVNTYVFGEYGFNNVVPFKDNLDKFSFYALYSDSILCSFESNTIICEDITVKKTASKCPNDYVFVLADRNALLDFVIPVRSSSYLNIGSINTKDHELVLLHEFGHLFGNLVDEYIDETSYKNLKLKDAPNCDNNSCNKWKNFNNSQCLKGCALNSYYRSKDYTIMRNYFKSKTFGDYNEWLLNISLH